MNVVPFPHMLQIVYRDGLSLYPCMIIPYYLNLLHHTAMPMLSVDCSPDPPVPSETVFLLQIKYWTKRDPVLSCVLQFILSGWSDEPVDDIALKPYINRKLELSTQDRVILWGNCMVVPPHCHDSILDKLHLCHPGVSDTKMLSRMFVWSPPSVPLQPWKRPSNYGLDFIWTLLVHSWCGVFY